MINKIVELLNNGEVVLLSTDTVYGLHADALNIDSIKKVDIIKGSNKPHLMLVSNIDMLKKYVKNITPLHKKIMNKYWPGELTILFEKKDTVLDELTKSSNLVGIRIPKKELLIEIIDKFNKPLLSTSANITNEEVITNIKDLDKKIKNKVSYIYDDGELENVASTIIKIEDNKIVFIREGYLAEQIKNDFKEYL